MALPTPQLVYIYCFRNTYRLIVSPTSRYSQPWSPRALHARGGRAARRSRAPQFLRRHDGQRSFLLYSRMQLTPRQGRGPERAKAYIYKTRIWRCAWQLAGKQCKPAWQCRSHFKNVLKEPQHMTQVAPALCSVRCLLSFENFPS